MCTLYIILYYIMFQGERGDPGVTGAPGLPGARGLKGDIGNTGTKSHIRLCSFTHMAQLETLHNSITQIYYCLHK